MVDGYYPLTGKPNPAINSGMLMGTTGPKAGVHSYKFASCAGHAVLQGPGLESPAIGSVDVLAGVYHDCLVV